MDTCVVIRTRQHVCCGRIFGKKTCSAFKYPPFSEWIISEILKLWGYTFFLERPKFYVHSRNAIKYCWKMFSFWDKCIWIGCRKFPVLWWDYLASAYSMGLSSITQHGLTYGAETRDLTKSHAWELHMWYNNEKIG